MTLKYVRGPDCRLQPSYPSRYNERESTVENAFGADIDYAQLQKIYGAVNENETRYTLDRFQT
jgi:uncharacterized protein YfbU (UPF0304 family)